MNKKWMIALVMLVFCFPALALAASGQTLDHFETNYEQNVYFINENADRHLLPMVMTVKRADTFDGTVTFEIIGDVLSMKGTTDQDGQTIKACTIYLTAPDAMEYGSATYNDFEISGYHCYALLMAMDSAIEPAERYALVTQITDAIAQGNGIGTVQSGVYTLEGNKVGNMVILTFTNNTLQEAPVPSVSPEDDATQKEGDDAQGDAQGMM